jgi:hypothetical protein
MKRHDAVYARYSSHKQDSSTSIEVQLDQAHRQHRSLMTLMMNPAIDSGALSAFSRQIAEKEGERKLKERRLAQIGVSAAQGQERLGQAVRTAYRRVCENLKHDSRSASATAAHPSISLLFPPIAADSFIWILDFHLRRRRRGCMSVSFAEPRSRGR